MRIALFVASLVLAATVRGASHEVPADGSVTVDGTNVGAEGDKIVFAGSGTVKLSFPAKDGAYFFSSEINAESVPADSVITLDLSDVADLPVRVAGSFLVRNGARVVIVGGGNGPEVRFGGTLSARWDENMGGGGYSYFRCHDLSLQGGATVKFVDYYRYYSPIPKGDGISIDPAARLGLFAVGALENYLDGNGDVDLSDFSVVLHAVNALPPSKTVKVGAGKTFEIKLFANAQNEYAGSKAGTVTNDVVLAGGQLILRSMTELTLQGSVTGAGTVRALEVSGSSPGNTANGNVINGAIDFEGPIVLDQGSIRVTDAEFAVDEIAGNYAECSLILPAGATVSAALARGRFALRTSSGNASLSVAAMAPESDFSAAGSVLADVACAHVEYADAGGARHYATPAAGESFNCSLAGAAGYAAYGRLSLAAVPAGCALRIAADADVTVFGRGSEFSVRNDGGKLTLADEQLTIEQANPRLWLDAANLTRWCISTNASGVGQNRTVDGVSYPVVMQWLDARADRNDCYAFERRNYQSGSYQDFNRLYPIFVTNGSAGVSSCISFKNEAQAVRLHLQSPEGEYVKAKFAVLVYGSEFGGGAALLGQSDGRFARTAKTGAAAATDDDPVMLDDSVPVWLNGRRVVKNSEQLLSGGWDIVSVDVSNGGAEESINGLSFNKDYSSGGGALYAEVLLFDRVLDDFERTRIERSLAEKWGLLGSYAPDSEAVASRVTLSGTGETTVSGMYEVSGLAHGSLVIDGGSVVAKGTPSGTEEDVLAISDRLGWFDPNDEDKIQFYSNTDKAKKPLEMCRLYDHVLGEGGDAFLRDSGGGINNRAPWLNRAARVPGFANNWMDFSNTVAEDEYGNYFKFADANGDKSLPIRMAFILSDSSRGGGNPILDAVRGSKIKQRTTGNPSKVIWGAGTDPIVTGGVTYLNGAVIDGTTTGFTGGPELFAFSTTEPLGVTHLGNLDNSTGQKANGEILGESLFFSRVLTAAERQTVEAYLLGKWLGCLPDGQVSLQTATLDGSAGSVTAARAALPASADFAGTVKLTDTVLDYALTEDLSVKGGLDYPHAALSFPAEVAVRVALPQARVRVGDYVLATFAGISDTSGWTLSLTGPGSDGLRARTSLVVESGRLLLRVKSAGLLLIVR